MLQKCPLLAGLLSGGGLRKWSHERNNAKDKFLRRWNDNRSFNHIGLCRFIVLCFCAPPSPPTHTARGDYVPCLLIMRNQRVHKSRILWCNIRSRQRAIPVPTDLPQMPKKLSRRHGTLEQRKSWNNKCKSQPYSAYKKASNKKGRHRAVHLSKPP